MALKNPFKLEKLCIEAYAKEGRTGSHQTLTVMFNPSSFKIQHRNKFQGWQGINTSGRRAQFSHGVSEDLSLELVFDGTGVSDFPGLAPLAGGVKTVTKRIEEFLEACFYMDGETHEPKYLRILWGEGPLQKFDCRIESVDITYSSFDKNGSPLRATLATSFTQCIAPARRSAMDRKGSPDLSHHRIVREGDTLPLLCREIYGSPAPYLFVADANHLDDFRDLRPGQQIVFPPLVTEAPSA